MSSPAAAAPSPQYGIALAADHHVCLIDAVLMGDFLRVAQRRPLASPERNRTVRTFNGPRSVPNMGASKRVPPDRGKSGVKRSERPRGTWNSHQHSD